MTLRSAPRSSATVLVVEDDEAMRRMLATRLERRGFDVYTAGTAQEALTWAEREDLTFDVILLDLVLPDAWGSQVALSQTAFQPGSQCIFMSGFTRDDPVLRACTDLDDVRFLEKPFEMADLFGLIDEALTDRGDGGSMG